MILWFHLAWAAPNLAAPDQEVVLVAPSPIGSTVDLEVPFTVVEGSSSYAVALTNLEGTAFRFGEGGDTVDLGAGGVSLVFAPEAPGRYRAEVALVGNGCGTVEVRASAFAPCLVASPRVMDWGPMTPPDADLKLLRLQSCDGQSWTVDSLLTDNSRFAAGAPTPLSVTPLGVQVSVQFQPTDEQAEAGVLTVAPWGIEVELVANDCPNGDPSHYDDDGDGVSDCGVPVGGAWADGDGDGFAGVDGDCNDDRAAVFPGAPEVDGGLDDDCDGVVDEHLDADADGTPSATDCDDADPFAGVGEVEVLDGVDNDCDGVVDDGVEAAVCEAEAEAGSGCGCATGGRVAGWWWLGLLGWWRRAR